MQAANWKKTPTKVIKPDDFCRVCRCNPAVLGRGKCNLFSGKNSLKEELADRLSKVLDIPVTKADGVSSVLCYKCKREFEKFESYKKALQVDLGNFKKRYEESMAKKVAPERTKRCHLTPGASKKRPCTITSPPAASVQRLRTAVPRILCRPDLPNHDDLIVATTAASETEVRIFRFHRHCEALLFFFRSWKCFQPSFNSTNIYQESLLLFILE